jgi:hypothetical protein
VRGMHVRYTVSWDWEAPAGQGPGDLHEVVARGGLASIRVKTCRSENGRLRPELAVIPAEGADRAELLAAVGRRCGEWQLRYPGVAPVDRGDEIAIAIPDRFRTDHEQHFADVLDEFLRNARNPRRVAAWEVPNLLTKYAITTQALALARRSQLSRTPVDPTPRLTSDPEAG